MPDVTAPTRTVRDRFDRLVALLGRSARFWYVVVLTTIVGTSAAVVVTLLRPRTYTSETLILYREGIRSADFGGEGSSDAARKLGLKLKEMVLSRTRLRQIVEEFKLYPKIVDDRGYVDAVDEMRTHIAFRTRDGDTFGLSFEGDDQKTVQAVTAKLAEALIDENSRDKSEQANTTRDFLEEEHKRNETELREKETALARFLAQHPEFAKENTAVGGALKQQQLQLKTAGAGAPKDPTLLALERQALRIEERLGTAPKAVTAKKEAEVDPQLLATRNAAQAELESASRELYEKRNAFTEKHPDVLAAKARVERAQSKLRLAQDMVNAAAPSKIEEPPPSLADRAQLEADLNKIKQEITDYKAKRERRVASGAPVAAPTSDANRIVALETDWERLSREVNEARERQNKLEEKKFRAQMQAKSLSSGGEQMVVVDPAYLPTHPSKGSRTVIAGVSLGASFLIGVLLALGCGLLDDRLYDADDVEQLGLTTLLASVPRDPLAPRFRRSRG
jgi:uncharacterized protein involved in exopolysaccharide biosynthesis